MPAATSKDQKNRAKSKPPPAADWPWWKLSGAVLLVLSGFAVGFVLVPFPSSVALWIAGTLIVLTAAVAVRSMPSNPWWAQVTYMNAWLLLILGIGVRNWAAVIPVSWLWVVPMIGGYVAAWTLPIIRPKFATMLAREQVDPKTRLGQGCLTMALIVFPVAAAIGPSFGLFAPRWGLQNELHVFIAVISTLVAVGGSQFFASHLWPKRPWAEPEP